MKGVNLMKRRKVLIITGAVAAAFAGLAITVVALGTKPAVSDPVISSAQYLVRAESGKVTVFKKNSELPVFNTEIDTSGLREYDRRLLEQGIEIEGYDNMVGLLEDFSN